METIKFGTDGWRAIIAESYTIQNLSRVAEATGKWLLSGASGPSVIIGYDCRFNGKLFAETTANILAQMGVRVYLTPGFSSTPMISFATERKKLSAGIIITASHNPPEYSGFKIKGYFGGPAYPSMIKEVESLIPDHEVSYSNQFEAFISGGQISYFDAEALYIDHLRTSFDIAGIQASGMKIGYDAMYGAGQNVIRQILPDAHLLHCEYNPSFLGTAPEPIEKNLQEFEQLIAREKLSIGLATDGDADRIGLYDERAQFVDSHHILLLLIHYLHKYKNLSGKVVVTFSVCSKVEQLCKLYNLPYQVTQIGFKYIAEIMVNENVMTGGEESGGIAITGHVPERDGIFIGLTLMEFMAKTGKKLTELIEEVYSLVGSFSVQRYDLHLKNEQKEEIINTCRSGKYQAFGKYVIQEVQDLDGFKFIFSADEWVMIRPSGTEPVLRVYAQSATRSGAFEILDATKQTILG
ncbi:MAG: phosphoglucomutase/phosphomannomutase family protein [Sphingobacteriia bacterium]|nr:phosphoglucomutase/phosphomannomutase family protein [Sphingobacteriia bacterium]